MMVALVAVMACAVLFLTPAPEACAAEKTGEALYKEHCAVCHPDGMNIINPKKTLRKKDLDAHNVKTEDAIVKLIRNPGPGMTKFDTNVLSERDAREIAKYIIKTFNK
jgi:cytochrome c6